MRDWSERESFRGKRSEKSLNENERKIFSFLCKLFFSMKRVFVVDEDEECDASPNVGAELLPLSPSARRIPSALECVLSSMSNTYVVNSDIDNYDNNSSNNINNKNTNKNNPVLSLEERWAALAQSLSLPLAEAQWPPPPPPGGSLLFAPPLLQRKRKTQLHTPKKMKMRNLQEQQQEQDEEEDDEMAELRNGEKLEGAWVPWGEGRLRSNDGRLHFSLRASELPAACCREAFPCSSDFAPCVPVGHRALGTLRVAQLAARRSDCESMLMQTSIISGGCRPRYTH